MYASLERGPLVSLLLSAVLVFCIFPAAVVGDDDVDLLLVRAKGRGEGTGVVARREAVSDAVRKVMREVLVKKAHREDLTLLRPILRFADRYVARYEILRVDDQEDSTTVEADIYLHDRDIDRDIARVMLPHLPKPLSILLLLGEKAGPDQDLVVPDFSTAETTLRAGLEGLGLKVSGVDSLGDRYTHPQLIEVVTGGAPAGARFALEREADVVVVGEASIALEGTAGSGEVMRSVATINLRVFRGSDGDMVYDLNSGAAIYSEDLPQAADQAFEDAAQKLVGDTVMAAVLAMLGEYAAGPDMVTLFLEAPRTEARVTALVDALRGDPEISSSETRFFSEKDARVHLGYTGPMSTLTELLDGSDVEGRTLRVRTVVGREITARFD